MESKFWALVWIPDCWPSFSSPVGRRTCCPVESMSNAKSNDEPDSVRIRCRSLIEYPDGSETRVRVNAYSDTVSGLFGTPACKPDGLSHDTMRAQAARNRMKERMSAGELTGVRSSGSTRSRCLTSTSPKPTLPARMATIRDVVEALSRSNGVDAVVVVGRDGLPIDSRVANGVDAESVAALLPSAIKQMAQLGDGGGRGDFNTAVLEFSRGLAIVAVLNAEALLIVLVQPATNVGALLFDLRRHRTAIAGLL